MWLEAMRGRKKVYLGVYYGPQEKCINEQAYRKFSKITTQVNKLKKQGEIVIMGDFNATSATLSELVAATPNNL